MTTDRRNYDALEQIALDLDSLARQIRRCQTSIFKDKEGTMERRKSTIEMHEELSVLMEKSARTNPKTPQPTPGQERLNQLFETLIAELKAFNENLDSNEPTA